MPKKLTTVVLSTALITSLGLTAVIGSSLSAKANTTAELATSTSTSVLASTNDSLVDETIYVFTESDGSARKVISSDWTKSAGSDVYTKVNKDNDVAPLDLKVTYKLDGKSISAKDLAGKSGKVTVRFAFKNNDKDGDYYIPYTVISGALLDNEHFKNLEVKNGKILNDGDRTVVAGVTLPGMQENLNLSTSDLEIPSYFEFTADVTDFEMPMTLSLATTKLFSELDTSKLDSLDNIDAQLSTLTDSMNALVSGSSELYQGMIELYNKSVGSLASGVSQLAAGSAKLKTGAETLLGGVQSIYDNINTRLLSKNDQLTGGAYNLVSSVLAQVSSDTTASALIGGYCSDVTLPLTIEKYESESVPACLKTVVEAQPAFASTAETLNSTYAFYVGVVSYTSGLATINEDYLNGQVIAGLTADEGLINGVSSLNDGLQTLNSQTPTLIEGIEKLKNGSGTLSDGLNTFNEQGIKKITSLYRDNLSGLSTRLKKVISLSKDHQKVKYIYRTDEVKK